MKKLRQERPEFGANKDFIESWGDFFRGKKKTWQTNQWGWKTCSFTWSLCILCDSVWMIWFMVLWKDTREKYIKFIIHGILNLDVEIFWIFTVSYRCSCLSFAILSVWFHTASVPGVCTIMPACPTFVAQTAGLSDSTSFGGLSGRWRQSLWKVFWWWTETCTNLIDLCHTEIFGALCLHIYVCIHVCVYMYIFICIYVGRAEKQRQGWWRKLALVVVKLWQTMGSRKSQSHLNSLQRLLI